MVKEIVLDCETDGLLDSVTKIHVISYTDHSKKDPSSITNYDAMRKFFKENEDAYFVIHNGVRFDIRVFEKILGIKIPYHRIIDSLAISWYLNINRPKHGLGTFLKDFGIAKPEIDDWKNLTTADYCHRCEEDVKINVALWKNLRKRLMAIYRDEESMYRLTKYLSFKMDCAAEQEELGWRVDTEAAKKHIVTLEAFLEEKVKSLEKVMPMVPKYVTKRPPKVMYKKDGSISSLGERWIETCKEHGKDPDKTESIQVLKEVVPPNPGSPQQVKDWLYSLGWVPTVFKYDGDRKIPQVRDKGELSPCVEKLIEKNPDVKELEGMTVAQHRLSIFNNFISEEYNRDGFLTASVNGFTNTLRFKHANPLVNLPGVDKPWGKEIRSCLLAPDEDHVVCGADMVSLESNTKCHYMMDHDPEYASAIADPDFDEHLDLAVQAGYLKPEDYHFYTTTSEEDGGDKWKAIHKTRKAFKPVNYGGTYGVGGKTLALQTGMTLKEATKLVDAYRKRNWAIQAIADEQKVRVVNSQMWLFNPVSELWYSLRHKKDKFSTLNQGTGVYCFDTTLAFMRAKGVKECGQFHDEYAGPVKKGDEEDHYKLLKWAVQQTNKKLKLKVNLDIDPKFGANYAEVH